MGELSQSALNTEMQTLGVGRYRNKVESARQRDAEIETNYGQRLMRGVLPEFTKGIEDWKNTVAFYDRVLVLDRGRAVEHDTPLVLLQREGGAFRELAERTGDLSGLLALARGGDEA